VRFFLMVGTATFLWWAQRRHAGFGHKLHKQQADCQLAAKAPPRQETGSASDRSKSAERSRRPLSYRRDKSTTHPDCRTSPRIRQNAVVEVFPAPPLAARRPDCMFMRCPSDRAARFCSRQGDVPDRVGGGSRVRDVSALYAASRARRRCGGVSPRRDGSRHRWGSPWPPGRGLPRRGAPVPPTALDTTPTDVHPCLWG
jgi:hypothetical protein